MPISTERVRQYATDEFMFAADDVRAMAAELLAVREAQPVAVTDEMAMDFHRALTDSDIGSDDLDDIKIGLRGALCNFTAPPAPAVPAGFKLVPVELTAENGAKASLIGEFTEVKFINCPECFGDAECESCDGGGRIKVAVPVSWTTIKAIWKKGIEHFDSMAAAPTPTKAGE